MILDNYLGRKVVIRQPAANNKIETTCGKLLSVDAQGILIDYKKVNYDGSETKDIRYIPFSLTLDIEMQEEKDVELE